MLCFPTFGYIQLLDSEPFDGLDISTQKTILTHTPSGSEAMLCKIYAVIGSAGDPVSTDGGFYEFVLSIGDQIVQPSPERVLFSDTGSRTAVWTSDFLVPPTEEVVLKLTSPNSGDTSVDVTAYIYDIFPVNNSSGVVEADAVALSGDTNAADNLESMYDGTGYADDNAPSTQLQLATISGGVSVFTVAIGRTLTEGDETLTFAATTTDDGIYYEVASDTISDDINFYLLFNTGDGMNWPVSFHLHGYYEDNNPPSNSTLLVQAYNFNIADWDTILTLSDSATPLDFDLPLHIHDVDPDGGGEGDVRIRFKLVTTEVSQNMLIDHATVSYVSGGLTVADIADGIWDEDITGHVVLDSAGGALDAVGTAIDNRTWSSNLNALLGVSDIENATVQTAMGSQVDNSLQIIGLDELIFSAIDGETLDDVVNDESVMGFILAASDVANYDRATDSVQIRVDNQAAIITLLDVSGTLYDNIVAIKAIWDSLTITGGYLEIDVVNLDGTAVKSTNGNIHALPGNI